MDYLHVQANKTWYTDTEKGCVMFQPNPKIPRTEVNNASEINTSSQGIHENNPDQGVIPGTSGSTNTFNAENAFQEPGNDTVKLTFPDGKVLHVSKAFLEICSRKFEQIFGPMSTESDTEGVEIAVKHQYEPFLCMLNFLHPRIQKKLDEADGKSCRTLEDIECSYLILSGHYLYFNLLAGGRVTIVTMHS